MNNRNGNLYYFLVQRLGSAIIFLRLLVYLIFKTPLFKILFLRAILLKLGGAPFQGWYIKLIQKINWGTIWLLSVWQKLIPLILLSMGPVEILLIFRAARIFISRINRIKQKKIKKILGLSSIFSLGWVLSILSIRRKWVWFIVGYGIALINLISNTKLSFLYNVESVEKLSTRAYTLGLFFLGLLIVRGLPPFIMFFLKVTLLVTLAKIRLMLAGVYLVIRIFIIYIYLIIAFTSLRLVKSIEISTNNFLSRNLILRNSLFLSVTVSVFLVALV